MLQISLTAKTWASFCLVLFHVLIYAGISYGSDFWILMVSQKTLVSLSTCYDFMTNSAKQEPIDKLHDLDEQVQG